MKTSLVLVALAFALAACGSAAKTAPPANGPVCLTSGFVPASESMTDYGTVYTPDMDNTAAPPPAARAERRVRARR